ncbi:MAG: hypothetical protein H7276_02305 [Caulobacter sp.]|nr:hypothetical protein [Vitreoscilla sp.]
MTTRFTDLRRRASRAGSVRLVQRGSAVRGAIVAAGLVAAVALQLAGPRLQTRLADLVGAPGAAPVTAPASTPACGSPSADNPMHPCKVAVAIAGTAPVI